VGGADFEITFVVHDVIANDDHTVGLGEATTTRGRRTLVYRTAEIHHVRDGKVVERWAFSDDTVAITAPFASPTTPGERRAADQAALGAVRATLT
jgi:ketosteroid isomerase-like protein